MSKYEELCAALGAVREEYQAYRFECYAFVAEFLAELRDYLQAPEAAVTLFAKFGSFAGRKVDGPAAALHLHDDTFWHFGIAIDLHEIEGQMPYHTVGFDCRLKKIGGSVQLQVEDWLKQTFAADDRATRREIFARMCQFLKDRYRGSFRQFVVEGDATRRFGF